MDHNVMRFMLQCFLIVFIFAVPKYLFSIKRISGVTYSFAVSFICFIYILSPVVFHFTLDFQRDALYPSFVHRSEDLTNLSSYELTDGRNFYITTRNSLKLGVWHLLPKRLNGEGIKTEEQYNDALRQGYPVVLYVHGNSGSRATAHRLELYRFLIASDYHVITFDYRSYGDSTFSEPYEGGLVEDAEDVYLGLSLNKLDSTFIWGHSIGSGLATHLASKLQELNIPPSGVILESSFPNMASVIELHPLGRVFRLAPWYNWLIASPYNTNGENFNSKKYILEYSSPTLILHSEDDSVIPYTLGLKLYQNTKKHRKPSFGPVSALIEVARNNHYGHNYLCRSLQVRDKVQEFINRSLKYKYQSSGQKRMDLKKTRKH